MNKLGHPKGCPNLFCVPYSVPTFNLFAADLIFAEEQQHGVAGEYLSITNTP
jgi:hypothetical protein